MENFDNVYTVEMNGPKGWDVIFTTVSSQAALNEFCRCDAEDDGYQYRLTSMLTQDATDEEFDIALSNYCESSGR